MKLYTVQMAKAKNREGFIDITVKSAKEGRIFAPTWYMVMDLKKGKLTEEQYTQEYYDLMRRSFKTDIDKWFEILKRDKVVLGCYCKSGDFCHRILLMEIFEKLCAKLDIEFEYCGEI